MYRINNLKKCEGVCVGRKSDGKQERKRGRGGVYGYKIKSSTTLAPGRELFCLETLRQHLTLNAPQRVLLLAMRGQIARLLEGGAAHITIETTLLAVHHTMQLHA